MRIGLLGGSFDPIHYGHLNMAKKAYKQLKLDKVFFIVSADTPLKKRTLNDYDNRLNNVKKVIKPYRKFYVCDIERNSEGKNYTYNTLVRLHKLYPNDCFYFIIGGDQVNQFDKWYQAEELTKICNIAYFNRQDYEVNTKYNMISLNMPLFNVSSSEIRNGHKFYLTNSSITYNYLINNYLEDTFLKQFMSDYRYKHSLSVANLCKEIAIANNLDGDKAYLMGLLHDINKEFKIIDEVNSEKIIKILKPELLEMPKSIWHGMIGSFIINHQFKIKDKDILKAVENHVLGQCKNRYAMVLYVSDKLDPLRDYDTSNFIKLCKKDLYKGYQAVLDNQREYYGEENYG